MSQFRARFEFIPETASDFLPDGQTVTEMSFVEISEIVEYVQEFADFLSGSLVYSVEANRIVDLNDFLIK